MNILDRIVADKHIEVSLTKTTDSIEQLEHRALFERPLPFA